MDIQTIAKVFCIGFSCLPFGTAILHEYFWWKKRNWKHLSGTIIGFEKKTNDGVSYPPIIEYETSERTRKFVSSFSSNIKPSVGTTVEILVSPDEESAEQYLPFTRAMFTGIFLAAGVFSLLMASWID